MQEPESPPGSPPAPAHRRKKRQKRTVYSIEQRLQLEEFYKKKRYGTYEERETLAKQVTVQEHQVQVWLKNRRAKDRRLQRLRGQQGQGAHAVPEEPEAHAAPQKPEAHAAPQEPEAHAVPQEPEAHAVPQEPEAHAVPQEPEAHAAPQEPEAHAVPQEPAVCVAPQEPEAHAVLQEPGAPAPKPAPAPVGLAFQGYPVLPAAPLHHGSPAFCSLPRHSPFEVFPEAERCVFSYSQACWGPAQGVQGTVPTAPAPAPAPAPAQARVWPQGPHHLSCSTNPVVTPRVTELPSPKAPWEGPFSSCQPWAEPEEDSYKLLDL